MSDEVYADLCEAKRELNDAVSNKLSEEIIAKLQRRVNLLETANELENDKLDELLLEYQYLEKKAKNANVVFRGVADKCRSFLYIINQQSLYTIQKMDDSLNDCSMDIKDRNQPFFPMDLIRSIYNLCNGKQFEEVPELEFYKFLNLQKISPLKIMKGEKARVCFLIYLLAESWRALQRAEWKKNILNRLGISKEIYHSKYKDPVSDLPSRANQEFAEALKEIFQ